jgi:hypothetical protein
MVVLRLSVCFECQETTRTLSYPVSLFCPYTSYQCWCKLSRGFCNYISDTETHLVLADYLGQLERRACRGRLLPELAVSSCQLPCHMTKSGSTSFLLHLHRGAEIALAVVNTTGNENHSAIICQRTFRTRLKVSGKKNVVGTNGSLTPPDTPLSACSQHWSVRSWKTTPLVVQSHSQFVANTCAEV